MTLRKSLAIFLCTMLMIVFAGCGSQDNTGNRAAGSQTSVQDVLDQGMTETSSSEIEVSKENESDKMDSDEIASQDNGAGNEDTKNEKSDSGIDVDLTVLSSTMVYSEVYNMMYHPEQYIGKTVKMKGMFTMFHDDTTNKNYFGCIVKDATACCAQGIEFELTGDYAYPDDYPAEGNDICVIGTFATYEEGENTYCTLRNARLDGKS